MFGPRRPLTGGAPASPAVWAEILDGGQAFRWRKEGDGWTGVIGRTVVRVFPGKSGVPEFSCLKTADTAAVRSELVRYLDGNGAPGAFADTLPWRSDAAPSPGDGRRIPGSCRILRQPPAPNCR